jgi:hypothetical protein
MTTTDVQEGTMSQSSTATIESRLQRLEQKVDVLSEALLVLAHGAEGGPLSEPGGHPAANAARQAYELLLAMRQGDGPDAGK